MARNLAPLGCKISYALGAICPPLGTALWVAAAVYMVSDVIVDKMEEKKKQEAGKQA